MAPKWGNNLMAVTLRIQDREFSPLMSGEVEEMPMPGKLVEDRPLRLSLFEILRYRNPATAYHLGWLAGWPECGGERV